MTSQLWRRGRQNEAAASTNVCSPQILLFCCCWRWVSAWRNGTLSSEDLQFYTDDSPSSLINYTQQIHCDTQAQCISKQWCVCSDFYMGDKLRHCLTGPGRKLTIFSTHSPWYFHISTWTCLKHSVSVCFCLFRCCDDAAVQGMCSANCVAVRREHKHSGEIEKRKCFDLNWLWRVDLEHVR